MDRAGYSKLISCPLSKLQFYCGLKRKKREEYEFYILCNIQVRGKDKYDYYFAQFFWLWFQV